HFTSSDIDPRVALPGDYAFTASDNGTHSFSGAGTLYTTGAETIAATDTATSSITGSATVNVSALIQATKLSVTTSVSTTTAGNVFSVTITAQDDSGVTATGYRGTV